MTLGALNWLYNLMMCGVGLFASYLGLVSYFYLRGLTQTERGQDLSTMLKTWWKNLNKTSGNGRVIREARNPSELLIREALEWSESVVGKPNYWEMLQTHLQSLQSAILDNLCFREMQGYQKIQKSMTQLGMAGTVIGMSLAFEKVGAAGPDALKDVIQSMSLAFLSTLNGLAWSLLLHFGEATILNQHHFLEALLSKVPGEIVRQLAGRPFLDEQTRISTRPVIPPRKD